MLELELELRPEVEAGGLEHCFHILLVRAV